MMRETKADDVAVSLEHLDLLLSGPGASGSRPMPDGEQQEPGAVAKSRSRIQTATLSNYSNRQHDGSDSYCLTARQSSQDEP